MGLTIYFFVCRNSISKRSSASSVPAVSPQNQSLDVMRTRDRSAKHAPTADDQAVTVPQGMEEAGTSGGATSRRAVKEIPPTEGGGNGEVQLAFSVSSCSATAPSAGGQEGALAGATSSQKRGRAQKKRARKVKDKMRQLCVDAAAAAGTPATAEGVGSTAGGVEARRESDGRRSLSSGDGSGVLASTLWPKLERAARDLAALAWARAQPGNINVSQTAKVRASSNDADAKSSTMLETKGDAGVPPRDGEGAGKPTAVASLGDARPPSRPDQPDSKDDRMESPCVKAAVDGLLSLCGTSSEIATTGKVGNLAPDAGEQLAQIQTLEPKGLCNELGKGDAAATIGCDVEPPAREIGNMGKPQPVTDIAGNCGTALVPANTDHDDTEHTAVVEFDSGAATSPAETLASRHRKTRRGKRAGGAINRRRGAKERAAGCIRRAAAQAEATIAAEGRGGTAASSSHDVVVIGDMYEGDDVDDSQLATPSIVVRAVDAVPPLPDVVQGTGAKYTNLGGGPTEGTDAGRDSGGVEVECESGSKDRSQGRGDCGPAIDVATPPCVGRLSMVDTATLELAAVKSARELLAMFYSSTVAVGSSGKQAGKSVRESLLPVLGTAPSPFPDSDGTTLLQLRVRQQGVLESLVCLCAPLPWTPVPRASSSSISSPTQHRSPISPSVAATSDILPDSGVQSQQGRGKGDASVCTVQSGVGASNSTCATTVGMSRRKCSDDSLGTRLGSPAPRTPSRSAGNRTAGARRGGGSDGARVREELTESSMGVLLKALGDPGNREYVLKIDGTAPLVRKDPEILTRSKGQSLLPSLGPF